MSHDQIRDERELDPRFVSDRLRFAGAPHDPASVKQKIFSTCMGRWYHRNYLNKCINEAVIAGDTVTAETLRQEREGYPPLRLDVSRRGESR